MQALKARGRAADGGAAGSRKLSEQEQQMFDLINSDPLDLKNTLPRDYTNWASLLNHVRPNLVKPLSSIAFDRVR